MWLDVFGFIGCNLSWPTVVGGLRVYRLQPLLAPLWLEVFGFIGCILSFNLFEMCGVNTCS